VCGELVHTIPQSSGSVAGIVLLNDQIYVCYGGSENIAVYNPTTLRHQKNLFACFSCRTLTAVADQSWYCDNCGTFNSQCKHCVNCGDCTQTNYCHNWCACLELSLCDIVGCSINNCLYASDKSNYVICKVFVQDNSLSLWSLDSCPEALSVTSSHNLLVALSDHNALNEYSTDGVLIRQVSLQSSGISEPVHAVQLSEDQYAVTHHGPTSQFSIVNSDGELVQSYSGNAADINLLRQFAVDKQGRAFVADQRNNRILVVNLNTLSAYQLPLPADCQLDAPCSIYYDSTNSRLYIGEWNRGRIFCFALTCYWSP